MCMFSIMLWRTPFKIFRPVIKFITVLMINYRIIIRIIYKCKSNQFMNLKSLTFTIYTQIDHIILTFTRNTLPDKFSGFLTPDMTIIRSLIIWKSWYIF